MCKIKKKYYGFSGSVPIYIGQGQEKVVQEIKPICVKNRGTMEIQNKYLILINLTIVNIIYIKILLQGTRVVFSLKKEEAKYFFAYKHLFVALI